MVNKVSHSFYVPIVLGCFCATKLHRTVAAETAGPTKPKILCSFAEKVAVTRHRGAEQWL